MVPIGSRLPFFFMAAFYTFTYAFFFHFLLGFDRQTTACAVGHPLASSLYLYIRVFAYAAGTKIYYKPNVTISTKIEE